MSKQILKKVGLFFDQKFLSVMHRVNYKYYAKHYPLYLKRMGVQFSGDISKTGFIAGNVKFGIGITIECSSCTGGGSREYGSLVNCAKILW